MKNFSFLSMMTCTIISFGQVTNTAILDENNISTRLSDGGVFFTNSAASIAEYEVPKGNGVSAIYAMTNWFGGIDVNGQLFLSAETYNPQGDFQPGPLTTTGSADPATAAQWPQTIFAVSKSEIDYHIQNYMNSGYVVPQSLLDWPAHGDISLGFDFYLAPFVDTDGDGIYDPTQGDYPCIKGDRAVYIIMNDKKVHTTSGGNPIGLELHYMFYQYATNDNIDNTTFLELRMINRGTMTLHDFKYSTFVDADLGYYGDDYMGSDSTRNMSFVYNADNFDEASGSSLGYGANPPAIGLISLSDDISSSLFVGTNSLSTSMGMWNAMNILDPSGQPILEPGSNNSVHYFYNGNPEAGTGSTEVLYSNAPNDRRLLATIDIDWLVPNQEEVFDLAFIFNQGSDNLNSVGGLFDVADNVQAFFDGQSVTCFNPGSADLSELTNGSFFSVLPNPSNGEFTIELSDNVVHGELAMVDMTGRKVLTQSISNGTHEIKLNQPAGVYMLIVETNLGRQTERIIIE